MDAVKVIEEVEQVKDTKTYTIEDIYALPDGVRAELINGEIYYMAAPSRTHQKISGEIYYNIVDYIKHNHGECEVYAAPFSVFLNDHDDANYLEPDITVVCDTSKLDEKGCYGAPDWVIEIVSPTSKPRDYIKKLLQYCTAGVREYWIVDPEKQMVSVYGFEAYMVEQYSFGDAVPSGILEGFFMTLEQTV